MNRIQTGDQVIVTVGKDRGKRGAVQAISGDRVQVSGVNVLVKHDKGGIVTKEGTIHISNIMLYDTKTNKGSRVSYQIQDGKKVRILKRSGAVLEGKIRAKN